jgi:two-component system OmpR family sensor kinase
MLSQIETAFRAQAASESQARASEERMRRFVADASHELRTPLTSIRGFAELYRQGAVADQADVARVMRRVEEEAARMGLLVEDLLLLARLDQQRPLVQEPVDLLSIAADVVLDARARHPQRSITLIAGESPVPPVVLGDDARLRQVATNLVSNAILHTPPEASAAVSLQVEGDDAVLRVSDTGPGMPPAEAARVFERFYRADASRTRATAQNGSGLGLSIVAALVAAHGGTVEVESRLGVGTTFAVRLPLAPGDLPHPAPNGNSSSTQIPSTQTPSIPAPIPPA